MINKKVLIGILIFFIILIVGFIQVNIINTKALSPIGNGEDNYELVKEEFGKDFEEFIKDDSEVKIYMPNEEIENTTVKIYDKEFIINMNNKVTEKIYNFGGFLYNGVDSIIDKISGKIDNKEDSNKKNDNSIEENNDSKNESEELDKIIDDFLENKGN